MEPGFVIPHNVVGNTLTLGVAPHALALGCSDPADPNFEKKNKGEYNCIICTFILEKRAVTSLQIQRSTSFTYPVSACRNSRFYGPVCLSIKDQETRDFATRILFDFLHIYRGLVNNPDNKELLVKDDMAGRKRWKKYDDYTKRGPLKIDHKFFYLYDSFTELKGKDPKDGKYDYYTLIH